MYYYLSGGKHDPEGEVMPNLQTVYYALATLAKLSSPIVPGSVKAIMIGSFALGLGKFIKSR